MANNNPPEGVPYDSKTGEVKVGSRPVSDTAMGRAEKDAEIKKKLAEAEPLPFKRYLILETGIYSGFAGQQITLKKGKVISEQHYDVGRLKDYGIKMRELNNDEARAKANPAEFGRT